VDVRRRRTPLDNEQRTQLALEQASNENQINQREILLAEQNRAST
jgi:hypothetical protein